MKSKIIVLLAMISLACSVGLVSADEDYIPMSPNYMGFDATSDVTVGDTFYTDIWVDVNQEIETASIDNMTFNADVLNYEPNTVFGDLLGGSVIQMTPESNGEINNVTGYACPITWGHSTPVNNTNGTLATIEMTAVGCGVSTLSITNGGTSLSGIDPGTTMVDKDINVHPQAITGLDSTLIGGDQIDLTWSKNTGDDYTLIRFRTDTYPTSVTDGTEVYNDTGVSTSHTSLTPETTYYYSAWGYNTTSGFYSLTEDTADETTNEPPAFGTPTPTDGSSGINTALTWQIPISDSEGDNFDWTIECSNGQSSSATGDSDGTKTLSLSGLDYSTGYTVWVNATDDGSGVTTSDSFTFTTEANTPPSLGTPTPTDGEDEQELSLTWQIPITEPDEFIDWTIECSNGQSSSATGDSDGTKTLSLSGLDYSTTYTVWVNATDGIDTVSDSFTFTTKDNSAPTYGTPDPEHGEENVDVSELAIPVYDADGHSMDVEFFLGTNITNVVSVGNATGVIPSERAELVLEEELEYDTKYFWYVEIDDGYGGTTRAPAMGFYNFTTEKEGGGQPHGRTTLQFHNLWIKVNDEDGLGIDGAQVTVFDMNTGEIVETGVTVNGTFSVEVEPDMNYRVTVDADGYESDEDMVYVEEDTILTFSLESTEPVELAGVGGFPIIWIVVAIALILVGFYIWYDKKE